MRKLLVLFLILCTTVLVSAQKPYRSAEVFSNDDVLYGKFVMRMKMIKGIGMQSTFFTQRSDSLHSFFGGGNIETSVWGGNDARRLRMNINSNNRIYNRSQLNYSLADNFNKYALVWTPDSIVWYINDSLFTHVTNSLITDMDYSMKYRFNAWIPCIADELRELFPQYYYIDWIEYYALEADTFKFEWRDDFDSFDDARWSKAEWTYDCNKVDFIPENAYIEDSKLVLAITDPNPSTSIRETKATSFTVFQNKSAGQVELQFTKEEAREIHVYSLSGVLLKELRSQEQYAAISYDGLEAGIYLVRVQGINTIETQQFLLK